MAIAFPLQRKIKKKEKEKEMGKGQKWRKRKRKGIDAKLLSDLERVISLLCNLGTNDVYLIYPIREL